MKINLLFISLFMLISINASASDHEKVVLKEGINMMDVNGDGFKDIVIYAKFDNNTSHPSNTMTIFIKNKNGEYNIVPVPSDAGFSWFDFSLSASTIKITGYELYKKAHGYFVISAYKLTGKENGEDVSDDLPVKFSRYDIKINNESPGAALFYWDLTKVYVTHKKYSDIDEAFNHLNVGVLK
ncbi:carbapenem self-resistance protein CarG family protein [Serratia plymuthica]|uniref:carbapenem self-resistance protein CarG family protein n=1 Tax=Serratia plymuthica TaxID=82996 RepID=UPI0018D81DFC|nr:spore coat protein CotH [Serratia plymuthica]QPS57336.1 spore coat protein CotH [Serratia plymuthica]CAI1792186.1 Uncharacterised protein [Serratia plymuthica]